MAKKEMYICDGDGCGTVLLHPEDGYVIQGKIFTGVSGEAQRVFISTSDEAPELVLCSECLTERLNLQLGKK